MNARVIIDVAGMQDAATLQGATSVHAIQDMKEMDFIVMVNFSTVYKNFDVH